MSTMTRAQPVIGDSAPTRLLSLPLALTFLAEFTGYPAAFALTGIWCWQCSRPPCASGSALQGPHGRFDHISSSFHRAVGLVEVFGSLLRILAVSDHEDERGGHSRSAT
jgi:hypothetical protein